MKTAVTYSYTFTPAAKTVDLSSISGFDVKKLYAIINTTANQVIFANGQSIYGLASIAGSVLTLVYNTTAMSSSDKLMIIYDDPDAVQAISVGSLPLPTGAATAANQATEISSLSSIASQTSHLPGALGQTTMSASLPVTLASDQTAFPVTVGPATDIVTSGTITALNGTVTINTAGTATVGMQASGTWVGSVAVEASVDGVIFSPTTLIETSSGIVAVAFSTNIQAQIQSSGFQQIRLKATAWTSGTLSLTLRANNTTALIMLDNPLPGGTNHVGSVTIDTALPTGANTIGSISNISGTVSLPTGASTSALQTTGNASLSSIDSKLTSPLAVTGPLTDTELRASAVPVSIASSPLPTGAATAANQATEIASLSSIDGKTPALGQALAAASVPVVLTAAQVSTLTPLSSVTVTQATGTNLHWYCNGKRWNRYFCCFCCFFAFTFWRSYF
jgi:hypothetical protein